MQSWAPSGGPSARPAGRRGGGPEQRSLAARAALAHHPAALDRDRRPPRGARRRSVHSGRSTRRFPLRRCHPCRHSAAAPDRALTGVRPPMTACRSGGIPAPCPFRIDEPPPPGSAPSPAGRRSASGHRRRGRRPARGPRRRRQHRRQRAPGGHAPVAAAWGDRAQGPEGECGGARIVRFGRTARPRDRRQPGPRLGAGPRPGRGRCSGRAERARRPPPCQCSGSTTARSSRRGSWSRGRSWRRVACRRSSARTWAKRVHRRRAVAGGLAFPFRLPRCRHLGAARPGREKRSEHKPVQDHQWPTAPAQEPRPPRRRRRPRVLAALLQWPGAHAMASTRSGCTIQLILPQGGHARSSTRNTRARHPEVAAGRSGRQRPHRLAEEGGGRGAAGHPEARAGKE